MQHLVIESPLFQVQAAQIWKDIERFEFIDWISENAEAGDVIPATGGMRKVRWARSGMGKRGGARVIYYTRSGAGQIVLMTVYTKAAMDNIRPEILCIMKERYENAQ